MSEKNKHQLSRYIPGNIKQLVRKRCGYGCVVCGNGIYQYEHFSPPFAEAKSHDANGITLLCGTCHDRKTRGQYSIEKIAEANSAPKCKIQGFTSFSLDVGSDTPDVILGTNRFVNSKTVIRVLNHDIFSFCKSEHGVCLINFNFYNSNGDEVCKIIENELISNAEKFDIQCVGNAITFKDENSNTILLIKYIPRQSLQIETLKMNCGGFIVNIDTNSATFEYGNRKADFVNSVFSDCDIGVNAQLANVQYGVGCKGGTYIGRLELK